MRADEGRPELSVVIASYNSRQTLEACLDSLERQATTRSFETILVDSSDDGTVELVRRRYPRVRVVAAPARLFPGSARNLGIAEARAGILAFLDTDCRVERGWVEAVLEAHRAPALLVGGVVENGTPDSRVSWAYYFCEFSHWLPGGGEREVVEVAASTLSLKRAAYDAWGPFLEGTYCSDTAFHWRAREDGRRVLLRPSIRVFHAAAPTLGEFLGHVAMHRQAYARVKVRKRRLGRGARLAHAMLAVSLPVVLPSVIAVRVARSDAPFGRFLACLPLLMAGLCARAWGEFRGYVLTPLPGEAPEGPLEKAGIKGPRKGGRQETT